MTLEEIKYFNDQFNRVRDELKKDIKELRNEIKETVGGHTDRLDNHEGRINTVENSHWRLTAILGAIIFITQILINVAIELFKK